MTKKIVIISLISLFLGFSTTWAYDYIKALDDGKNFFEIQTEANKYWKDKNVTVDSPKEKRGGLKQYKRWEWYWEPRVDENGNFPPAGMSWIEAKKYDELQKKSNKRATLQATWDPKWNFEGPTTAPGGYNGIGRVNCVYEDPGYNGSTNKILWAGSASGGLWKSTNAGTSWSQTMDDLGTLGVGDIVIHPTGSDTIYLATGDGDASDARSIGVLKSTDGGSTWNTTGLSFSMNQNYISRRLLMDPNNTATLICATNRGIYKTTNYGSTWTKVFSTSTYDMEYKPGSSTEIYASTYSQIYKSTNGGTTWTLLTGIPTSGIKRIALAVAPSNSAYVYAELGKTTTSGHLNVYRSTNSGTTWTKMDDGSKNLLGWKVDGSDTGGQSWYDLAIVVNPTDADEVYVGGVNIWKSTNGGTSWTCKTMWYSGAGVAAVHADQHFLYMPNNSRLYSGNDGSVDISTNQGTNWSYIGAGVHATQFYAMGISQQDSNYVICGAQDNSMFLKSSSNFAMTATTGDGFEGIIDYTNNSIMYCSSYYGNWRQSTNSGSSWAKKSIPSGESGAWLTPYIINPKDHNVLYFGYKEVYLWKNGSYKKLSNGVFGSTLNNLYMAPSDTNVIWAGTYATMKVTVTHGTSWTSITKPTTQSWTGLAIDTNNANNVWACFSGWTSGQKVYKSTNGGTSWTNISGTLPNVPCNDIQYEATATGYRLFVATDIGVFYRKDTDTDWTKLDNDLPNVVVTELEKHKDGNILFISTYGRGLWKASLDAAAVAKPPAPPLQKPLNGSKYVINSPTFYWGPVASCSKYNFQLSKDTIFSTNLYNLVNLSTYSTTGISISLIAGSTYYWRASAISNSGVTGDWSSPWELTVGSCEQLDKTLDITLKILDYWDGMNHRPVPVSVELRKGSALLTSTLEYEYAVSVGSSGVINCNCKSAQDGDYYIVVRAAGYLPVASTSKVSISQLGANYSFTSYSSVAGGKFAIHYDGTNYFMKPGDFDWNLKTNADDNKRLIRNNKHDLNGIVPIR